MFLSEAPIPEQAVIVFDLDDTLYKERDFVVSGFRKIAAHLTRASATSTEANASDLALQMARWLDEGHGDPIGAALEASAANVTKAELVELYRTHQPDIHLEDGVRQTLKRLRENGHPIGVMTDGRAVTQRNKIQALGVAALADRILISEEFGSEKPSIENYLDFERAFPQRPMVYIGDNVAKDFVTPNTMGWITIGLLDSDGRNVHPQSLDGDQTHLPQHWVESLS